MHSHLIDAPTHWEKKKLKYATKITGGYAFKSELFSETGISIVRIGDIQNNIDIDGCKKYPFEEEIDELFVIKNNDILIALSGATVGKTAIINNITEKAYVNQRVAKISYINRFLFYVIISDFIQEQIYLLSYGSAQENISTNDIANFYIPFPPLPEQEKIANFLDEKTTQIDSLITKKTELIALLQEEEKAFINEKLTTNTENWQKKKLKYVSIINPTRLRTIDIDAHTPIVFLPMEKVKEDGSYDMSIKKSFEELQNGFTYFEKDDIIFAKITPCFENGKRALLENLETIIGFGSTEFHVLRAQKPILKKYLYLIISSQFFREKAETFMTGSAGQKRVPTDFVANFEFYLPNIITQEQIIQEIEIHIEKSRDIAEKLEKEVILLKEYRQSLISEAVTGKVSI